MSEPPKAPINSSIWEHLPTPEQTENVWRWYPIEESMEATMQNQERLNLINNELLPPTGPLTWLIWGELGDVQPMGSKTSENWQFWADSKAIARAKARPIMFVFRLPEEKFAALPSTQRRFIIDQKLPPDDIAQYALVIEDTDWWFYELEATGEKGKCLAAQIQERIRSLAGESGWRIWEPMLDEITTPASYERKRQELRAQGRHPKDTEKAERELAEAYRYVQTKIQHLTRWNRQPGAAQVKWMEVQAMAQELLDLYWQAHLAVEEQEREHHRKRGRQAAATAVTATHRMRLPQNEGWRLTSQSLGPGVRPADWQLPQSTEKGPLPMSLLLPHNAGKALMVQGEDNTEHKIIRAAIDQELGPEYLKYMSMIVSMYEEQTGGIDQKLDMQLRLRDVLIRMGKGKHADDPDERRKLFHLILYAARVHITTQEADERDQSSEEKDYSPLFIIEKRRLRVRPDGQVDIPSEVALHLGEEYYERLHGTRQRYYVLPTAKYVGYHSQREGAELSLVNYLVDRLFVSKGSPHRVFFFTLMERTGIFTPRSLQQAHDRLRTALGGVYALEHIEHDDWVRRTPHEEIDTLLAIGYVLKDIQYAQLATTTQERLFSERNQNGKTLAASLQGMKPEALKTMRRELLQKLLKRNSIAKTLEFRAGPALEADMTKRVKGYQAAIERDQRSLDARAQKAVNKAAKQATPEIVERVTEEMIKRDRKKQAKQGDAG